MITMRRGRGIFLILAAHIILGGALLSVQDIIILPKTGHRKPPIAFNHKAHTERYGAKCIDCHHTGKNAACSTCHLRSDRGAVINLKGAFHQQCHNCHRKTSGPKGCSRCHKSAR
ncbi:MAG: hypothetical protein A2176_12495 [Spirochaetes bacterium RBG_13_51_14]|nr:MAG: hypothetical protein A2176_12495 [Spirochaetes bacterium RBG_13_51_14]